MENIQNPRDPLGPVFNKEGEIEGESREEGEKEKLNFREGGRNWLKK